MSRPTFPQNTQAQRPLSPSWDSLNPTLSGFPTWMAGSARTQYYQGSLFAKIIYALDQLLEPVQERIRSFRETNPSLWAGLPTEGPFWRLSQGTISGLSQENQSLVSTSPYITTNPFQLTENGTVVLSESGSYFLTLPSGSPSRECFWVQGYGSQVYLDGTTLYLKDLDRVLLTPTNTQEGNFIPYLGDSGADNYSQNNWYTFDTPLTTLQQGYRSVFILRGGDPEFFPYSGAPHIPRAWSVAPSGVVLPQAHVGDSIGLSYVSSGKSLSLQDAWIYFQGGTRYNNLKGPVSGPFLPADSSSPEREAWGVPSRVFLSQTFPILRKLRAQESAAERIQRLLVVQKIGRLENNARESGLRLGAFLGRLDPVLVTGTVAVSGNVYIPELEDRVQSVFTFSQTNPLTEHIREETELTIYPALLSPNPLLRRQAGKSYGGDTLVSQVSSRFSPFSRSSIVSAFRKELPTGQDRSWNTLPAQEGLISQSISDPLNRPEIAVTVSHPQYLVSGSVTQVVPGIVPDNLPLEGFLPRTPLNIKTIQDAYLRGDQNLRGANYPTPQWLAFTNRNTVQGLWSTNPLVYDPVANSAPFDLDLNLTPPATTHPVYGTGTTLDSNLPHYHPLAGDFA